MDPKLVECVRSRPALYDRTNPSYSNRDLVQMHWEQIASELNERTDVVKKKWNYLRDYFRKQRKIMSNFKSGQALEKKKKWPLYDAMTFLIPYSECYENNGSLDMSEARSEVEELNANADSPEGSVRSMNDKTELDSLKLDLPVPDNSKSKRHSSRKRKRSELAFDMQILNTVKELQGLDNENTYFFKSLQPLMKELDPLDAMKFRQEVQGLLITYVERARWRPQPLPTQSST